MPHRTQTLTVLPWSGGANTAVDSGLIPTSDLQIADNILFSSNGAKIKREGHAYWDILSEIPAVSSGSSSGTTRTLVFASTLTPSSIEPLVVTELIKVTSTDTKYSETSVAVATISGTNLTYTATSGSYSTAASATIVVTRVSPIVLLKDYWRFTGSANSQLVIASTSQPLLFKYDSSGRRTQILKDATATARVSTVTKQSSVVFNETLIIGHSGIGNIPIKYKPETDVDWLNLPGSPPDFSICANFLNRVWTNDKVNPDRLHYSATGNAEQWQGTSDSGAIDIRPGDGDPVGITGIYAFKGRVFVAKKNKMYQVVGDSPENFQVLDVSSGLGAESHLSGVAVDQDDFMFVSSKGIHSLATTASYSDFSSTYLSAKIQPTFNAFVRARLAFTQAAYLQSINSIAFSVSSSDSNVADTIWLYNTIEKEWYRWPAMDAQSLANVLLSNTPTLMYGTSDGKLVRTQIGTYTDFATTGIRYRVKSGTIYPDQSPSSIKGFKRLSLYFRPVGSYSATVRVQIDNYAEQVLTYSQVGAGDKLGVDFILGSSLLGVSGIFAPYTFPIDGYGRGCTIDIEQTGTEQQLAVYGYAIEWEPADMSQETVTSDE